MKKIIAMLIAAVFVVALAGCKTEADNPSKPTDIPQIVSEDNPNEPTDIPQNDLEDDSLGNFDDAANAYYNENSTELLNVVLGIYRLDKDKAILEFKYYDGSNEEMATEVDYAFTCKRIGAGRYSYEGTNQGGEPISVWAEIDQDGYVEVGSNPTFAYDFTGAYMPEDGNPEVATNTIIEYLRNIPEAAIGDFDQNNPDDEVEETLVSGWFHEISLIRGGEAVDRFLVADDFSVICRLNNNDASGNSFDEEGEDCSIIAGSFENTINFEEVYEYYNEDEDTFEEFSYSLVYPYISDGPEMTVGSVHQLEIAAPWNLTESIECSSSDDNVVAYDGGNVYAKAIGEANLKVTIHYGGAEKICDIAVNVVEQDEGVLNTVIEFFEENEEQFYDITSQRANMTIVRNEDSYCVDILWGDSAATTHHWSYLGEADETETGKINLRGSYVIETYDSEGYCSEQTVKEDIVATLTTDDAGRYYWHDDYNDAGKNCVFEKSEADSLDW